MVLARLGPDGLYAVSQDGGAFRALHSDPFETLPGAWSLGRPIESPSPAFLPPVYPGKIVGIGRNYKEHVKELSNPMPAEPVLFLKAPSSILGPNAPILLPPESARVEHEGEIAVVLRRRLSRGATADEARHAVLGITCANDVTARDLQKKDPTFARGKSFDTFCPVGPVIFIDPDLDDLEVVTRVNGAERQRGHVRDMTWGIVDLLLYASRMMTLEPGDLLLTGTPAGVGPLVDGDVVEVEVSGAGVLRNPVEALQT